MEGAGDIILIKKNKTKKLGRMVAPVYTLILTPWIKIGLAPQNDGYVCNVKERRKRE
jgi:hypothetical protein